MAGGGHFLVCDGAEWQSFLDYSATSGRIDLGIANDTGSCDATKTGRLRYDEADDEWEYCDGSDPWKSITAGGTPSAPNCTNDGTARCLLNATRSNGDPQFIAANIKDGVNILGSTGTYLGNVSGGSGGCTLNPACPNVDDVCSGDGSGGGNPKFAGCFCYYDSNSADDGTCKPLYVTQANQSTSAKWKTSSGADDLATDSFDDGKIADGQVANSATFPAFKLCKDLTDGGYTDWYLPAYKELGLLSRNRATISGFGAALYWSSSESILYNTNPRLVDFTDGSQASSASKTYNASVRCVRRD